MKHYKNALIGASYITISALICVTFFYWALNSLYDPKQIENRGHKHYAKKQYLQAYLDFQRAVEQNVKAASSQQKISEGYRLAASAAHANQSYSQAATMLRKAIQHNKNNEQAHHVIKHMLQRNQMKQEDVWKISQQQWNNRYRTPKSTKDTIKQGHTHFAKKRYAQAFKHFSYAADTSQTDSSLTHQQKSQYCRYAATAANAAQQRKQTQKYATRALQYNPENIAAQTLQQKATQ